MHLLTLSLLWYPTHSTANDIALGQLRSPVSIAHIHQSPTHSSLATFGKHVAHGLTTLQPEGPGVDC